MRLLRPGLLDGCMRRPGTATLATCMNAPRRCLGFQTTPCEFQQCRRGVCNCSGFTTAHRVSFSGDFSPSAYSTRRGASTCVKTQVEDAIGVKTSGLTALLVLLCLRSASLPGGQPPISPRSCAGSGAPLEIPSWPSRLCRSSAAATVPSLPVFRALAAPSFVVGSW